MSMMQRGLLRLVVNNDDRPMGDLGEFQTWMLSWGASDRTIDERCITITAALREWGMDPAAVTTALLTAWLARPTLAPWSRVTYYYHLRSYFGWLADTKQIPFDPTVDLRRPQQPRDKPHPLTADEVERLLAAARGNVRTWLQLALLAGLRAHEIAKIQGQDVNEQTIFVMGKGQVGAYIPTHPVLWELAQNYPGRGYWFPSRAGTGAEHTSWKSVSSMSARLFKSLSIDGSIHRCRHTFATNLLRNGENIRVVQELMRHASLATTAKYTAVDEAERARAIRGLVA